MWNLVPYQCIFCTLSLVRGTGGHRPVSQSNQIEDPCGHEVTLASPGAVGLCASIWPAPLAPPRMRSALPGVHHGAWRTQ